MVKNKSIRKQVAKDLKTLANGVKKTTKRTTSVAKKVVKTGKKATNKVDKFMSNLW